MTLRLLLALPLAAGCLGDREVLAPVAEAWGQEVAQEGLIGVQAGLGMAAVTAAVCGLSYAEWEALGTVAPVLPEEVAAWFGVEPKGVLKAYAASGQFMATWGGGSFFGQDVALKLSVASPTAAFVAYLDPSRSEDSGGADTGAEHDDDETLASMVLASAQCGSDARLLTGSASFPVSGDNDWDFALVPAEGAAGVAFTGGAALPSTGSASWSGKTDLGRATLLTHDAAEIADGTWPATAGGRGWSSEVALELR
jgi:hypothetical protein